MTTTDTPETQLGELFGSYRAEWLADRLYDLFTEPAYFPEMMAPTACVLEGGRGTGKTTVLRGLSYQGQHALRTRREEDTSALDFIGCYLRVDTNVVRAFEGPELQPQGWTKTFAHYFNLVITDILCGYWVWHIDTIAPDASPSSAHIKEVATSLHLPTTDDVRLLKAHIRKAIVEFESYINNIGDDERGPKLSLQGAPIRLVAEALASCEAFRGKRFFILLDEYENLLDYQQRVVNTLIKHGAPGLTYKIAIRELGWKCRTTLNPEEQLRSPADYVRINIGEKLRGQVFRDFALTVCNDRVCRLNVDGISPKTSIRDLLPALSDDEEATLLAGGAREVEGLRNRIVKAAEPDIAKRIQTMSAAEILLVEHLATEQNPVASIVRSAIEEPSAWRNKRNNYTFSMLFTLKRRKSGIRKYYAGWDTFIQLADGNIRLLLALVDQCLHLHLRAQSSLVGGIPPETQTLAAQLVGKSNLAELEGLSVNGARLTKLLLGLGRVFQVLAATPQGHAPEQTQFELSDEADVPVDKDVDELLRNAVVHLALVRAEGTKPTNDGDTKDWDYMVHPIFAAFFVFSHRKKRKIEIDPADLKGLVYDPSAAIKRILHKEKRVLDDEPLPEQMNLFRQFYSGTR